MTAHSSPKSADDPQPGISISTQFTAHSKAIEALAWAEDGRTIAAHSRDDGMSLWDVSRGGTIREAARAPLPVGTRLSINTDGVVVRLVDAYHKGYIINRTPSGLHGAAIAGDAAFLLAAGVNAEVIITPAGIVSATEGGRVQDVPAQLLPGATFTSAAVTVDGLRLALGASTGRIEVWDLKAPVSRCAILDHGGGAVRALTFSRDGATLVSGGADCQLAIWSVADEQLRRTIEGHVDGVAQVTYVAQEKVIASRDVQGNVRITDASSGASVPITPTPPFTPHVESIAATSSDHRLAVAVRHGDIELWDLDLASILADAAASTVAYASAKVVLLGDSGVGKTGLGWRLAHGEFREHPSTHGQQFWLLTDLDAARPDGTRCETVLWDLAGQPDYRLIHALFVDDADVAILVFDATSTDDPLRGVEYWLKQLTRRAAQAGATQPIKTILVSGRSDRGEPRLTAADIHEFCDARGLGAYVSTSALRGDGLAELTTHLQSALDWNAKPVTVTTAAFKILKTQLLGLKEARVDRVVVEFSELAKMLGDYSGRPFTTREVTNAVDHLARHGYVAQLRTSQGSLRLLLAPELLNNLAASLVVEARGNPRGLGSLEESALWQRHYRLPELDGLSRDDQDVLLDSAIVMFLEHSICFRETDPLSNRSYLVFPELINLRRPASDDRDNVARGPSYVITGATENVYASLVVLLGYTNTFVRTNQWRNNAEYVVGEDLRCGFVLEVEDSGRLEIALYFDHGVAAHVRDLFARLLESFLAGRDLTVSRYMPLECSQHHRINRADVVQRAAEGETELFCMRCGDRVSLAEAGATLDLSTVEMAHLDERGLAARRSQFEQEMFRLAAAFRDLSVRSPRVFISYAWGDRSLERWVEHTLAKDLANLGVSVLLDRWENARVGASVPRFVSEIVRADSVIVVGTPGYRWKYENDAPMRAFVVAAEGDLIGSRMLGSEKEKETVLPVLREGSPSEAFPPLLLGRVFADFLDSAAYFNSFWELAGAVYDGFLDPGRASELKRMMLEGTTFGTTWDHLFFRALRPFGRLGSKEEDILDKPAR